MNRIERHSWQIFSVYPLILQLRKISSLVISKKGDARDPKKNSQNFLPNDVADMCNIMIGWLMNLQGGLIIMGVKAGGLIIMGVKATNHTMTHHLGKKFGMIFWGL